MNQFMKDLCTLKPSSLFIISFGILTGFIGYTYKGLSEKPSDKDKLWFPILAGSAVILASIKGIDWVTSKEIDVKAKDKSDEDLNNKMLEFKNNYSQEIDELKKEIDSLQLSPTKHEKISRQLAQIKLIDQRFITGLKAAKEIANWLDLKENKKILIESAMDAVSTSNFQLNQEYLYKLDKDIRECIIWLRYSVESRQACKFKPEKYASATRLLPGVYQPYETALNTIKDSIQKQQSIQEYVKKTDIVEQMINYLTKEIKKIV